MKYITESKIGLMRSNNEDNLGVLKNDKTLLAIVCDGLGGYNAGDVASEIAVETILSFFEETSGGDIIKLISDSILEAHNRILIESNKISSQFGMSTTAEVLFVDQKNFYWGHVGDSRIYLFSENRLIQLTKDHSLVQQLIDQGLIDEKNAGKHPNKNIITHALGDEKKLEIDAGNMLLPEKPWKFFITTDGVTNVIDFFEIEELLKYDDLQKLSEDISNLIESRGAPDNYSFIIISSEKE